MSAKVMTAWAVSWVLYWLGHAASRLLEALPDTDSDISYWLLYRPYSWLMASSLAVQAWGGGHGGPWLADER